MSTTIPERATLDWDLFRLHQPAEAFIHIAMLPQGTGTRAAALVVTARG